MPDTSGSLSSFSPHFWGKTPGQLQSGYWFVSPGIYRPTSALRGINYDSVYVWIGWIYGDVISFQCLTNTPNYLSSCLFYFIFRGWWTVESVRYINANRNPLTCTQSFCNSPRICIHIRDAFSASVMRGQVLSQWEMTLHMYTYMWRLFSLFISFLKW